MKQFIFSSLATVLLLAACNSNKTNTTTTEDSSKTKTTTEVTTDNTMNDDQKKVEQMKKLPSLSTEQIKAMLPAELNGMKRSGFSANSMAGYGLGEATYKSDDGKEMRVMIWDCAGEAGAGFYSLNYLGLMNMEEENENGYKKSISFNGGKAVESYEKNQDKYAIMFAASDRLLVNVEGEKTGLDAVKNAASSLNLKTN